MAIPFAAGAVSRFFLHVCCSEVRIEGLGNFLDRLYGDRGILTSEYKAHFKRCRLASCSDAKVTANIDWGISSLPVKKLRIIFRVDEPFMWGILPLSTFTDSRTVRWTLGASDMMFSGNWFFSKGQVIETFRGKGIYQEAIDTAAQKLNEGRWVHIFPEGKIKQEDLLHLRRFKWGVSRLLMETKEMPWIIPIWIKGFDQVMNEDREFPRMIPRPGKKILVRIGEPINDTVEPLLEEYRQLYPNGWRPYTYARPVGDDLRDEPLDVKDLRIRMAAVMREKLMQLGASVAHDHEIEL